MILRIFYRVHCSEAKRKGKQIHESNQQDIMLDDLEDGVVVCGADC